jgi:diguanylate cyclase (GGDEF)-like protein
MGRGGDDFLTKPIMPSHLVSSITIRAQRSRILREFMVRDSLTGLLNHTETKARLNLEVARAKRNGEQVTFAMLDIDHFKRVNDTFGHLAGDGVIKSISRLLQQRLRKTDIIGRYGGEEFAVILPNTGTFNAEKVLNEIRESFSNIRHQGEKIEFAATFSCGIASFPQYQDPFQLNTAADQALYLAKDSGRNRLVVARPDTLPIEQD